VSKGKPENEIIATVNWDEAVEAGDLTQASAIFEERATATAYPDNAGHGTALFLGGLNQAWTPKSLVGLAREIWWLQPPFELPSRKWRQGRRLTLNWRAGEEAVKKFDFQMRAYLDVWQARLVGKLARGTSDSGVVVQLALEFADNTIVKHEYPVPGGDLHAAEFEVRIYNLQDRQPHGISVKDARDYLKRFGASMSTMPASTCLTTALIPMAQTEIDHSHRLSTSQLLPAELQLDRGMNFLPTISRMLGIVQVDTAQEHEIAEREVAPHVGITCRYR